ncbi:MAG: hypothetical protein IPN29_20690 [Saprospiraceae bacterium]|nr:hypothetical protein [Saprospiraceae bacterium]
MPNSGSSSQWLKPLKSTDNENVLQVIKNTFIILPLIFYGCSTKKELASELIFAAVHEIKNDHTCPPYLETDSVFITYTGVNSKNGLTQCSTDEHLIDMNLLNISQHSKEVILQKLRGLSLGLDILEKKTEVGNSSQHRSYLVISNIQRCKEDYFFSVHWIKNRRAGCGGDFHYVNTDKGLELVYYN